MTLTKYKIRELISVVDERNDLGIMDFYGININKEFMLTFANTEGLDEKKYKVVRKNYFVYSGMQTGRDNCIRISMYNRDNPVIVSPAYTTFTVTATELVNPIYFFMRFLSKEKDRYGAFCSDGSIRSNLDWDVFCDIEIELPPISIQQKYVDVYNAMLENQKNYECGLDDLKLVCDAYIEELRRQNQCEPIGNYVHPYNVKNIEGKIVLEQGINIEKKFITPHRTNDNFYGRKIVRKGHIAYCSQLNNENIAIALRTGPDCIVSNVYEVIEFNENCNLIPNYLMLWLVRSEFGRFVYWASQGTSYEFLTYENLANYRIPIPNVDIQKSIAKIYEVYLKRKEINEKLKSQLKDICPILIKGSIEEGRMKEA
ncbi:restriction endonuclease subunit S [Streptococcus constellatus]|uniref:restriction endonuclease subunit S n=1 Tax=Streptococcus constellatus TaxID=76860 RepID=UPI00241C79C3|nr:restriction endonuclease subunit S [Streptococcus constellatus]